MSKLNVINEIGRAAGTALLSATVAAAFFTVMGAATDVRANRAQIAPDAAALALPDRPAGGRRWRSSSAEQSRSLLTFYGEDNPWNRHHAQLEGAMSLFQIGGTFSSRELAEGAVHVTLTKDYLAAYLATPFLGGDAPVAFMLSETSNPRPIEIGPVLARAFGAELVTQQ